jgi:hypothetical protein
LTLTETLLPWLDSDPDRRAFLPTDHHVRKRGNAHHIQPIECEKPPGDGGSFDGLVNCPSTDCLDVCATMFTDNSRNSTSNGCRPGRRRNSDNIRHLDASSIF